METEMLVVEPITLNLEAVMYLLELVETDHNRMRQLKEHAASHGTRYQPPAMDIAGQIMATLVSAVASADTHQ